MKCNVPWERCKRKRAEQRDVLHQGLDMSFGVRD